MADDYTPAQIKQLMDSGALTESTANKLRPSEMAIYQKMRGDQVPMTSAVVNGQKVDPNGESAHSGLFKAAGSAAGMALPGLLSAAGLPEVGIPLWLAEAVMGGGGAALAGAAAGSKTPKMDAALGGAPALLGPAVSGLGAILENPTIRTIAGYGAGSAVGHPYIGAIAGRGAKGLGESIGNIGDTIQGVMPGALVKRLASATEDAAPALKTGDSIQLPRPNATGDAFGPSTGTRFGPPTDPAVRPGSTSDTGFWRRQPAPANLEKARGSFDPGGGMPDVPQGGGVKIDPQANAENMARNAPYGMGGIMPSAVRPSEFAPSAVSGKLGRFGEGQEGADSLSQLLDAIHGPKRGNAPNGGSPSPHGGGFDPREFPPGTNQATPPGLFDAAGRDFAQSQVKPEDVTRIQLMIRQLLGGS